MVIVAWPTFTTQYLPKLVENRSGQWRHFHITSFDLRPDLQLSVAKTAESSRCLDDHIKHRGHCVGGPSVSSGTKLGWISRSGHGPSGQQSTDIRARASYQPRSRMAGLIETLCKGQYHRALYHTLITGGLLLRLSDWTPARIMRGLLVIWFYVCPATGGSAIHPTRRTRRSTHLNNCWPHCHHILIWVFMVPMIPDDVPWHLTFCLPLSSAKKKLLPTIWSIPMCFENGIR